MAHYQQQQFCKKISEKFPKYFKGKKVLDIGSLDINGNNRFFLDSCNYIGLDVGEGPNVDVVQVAHMYDAPDDYFDLIISTEVFEHDMFYEKSVKNIMRMIKPGGAFIFTCASTGRAEHGTRRSDGSSAAPLLINISEEWSDYYKNLTREDFVSIDGFSNCFPDGIFEYNEEAGDIYFFGVKGGIKNSEKYSINPKSIRTSTGDYNDHIFVLDAWINTQEKERDLIECINRLKEFPNIPILLATHYPIKPEIQEMVDYYIYDKNNPILLNHEFASHSVASGRWSLYGDYRIDSELPYHHDYAIWTTMKNAFNFCKHLNKNNIHFLEYDNLIDTFQYKQAFLDRISNRDAIIYEYSEDSSVNHLDPYCATFIFSIKTDVAISALNQINSRYEYFVNKPKGWQLERVFLNCLRNVTQNIELTPYIANENELNTQAVWNRDGILRGDGIFQVYLGVDTNDNLYCHLLSGFHDLKTDKDYLLEIKYNGNNRFFELKSGGIEFINLGKYSKGLNVEVRYLGNTVFHEFLGDDISAYRKMSKVSKRSDNINIDASYNFSNGAYCEISGDSDLMYDVSFIDKNKNHEVYSTPLRSGQWARTNIKYFVDWKIRITDNFGNQIKEFNQDLKGKRVYVSLESNSLGDNIAWFPYVEEFRKKHGCVMICSTFWNDLFSDNYKDIIFIKPGEVVNDIYSMYKIGWFYSGDTPSIDLNPTDFRLFPLQKTSSDILGLEFEEIKPRVTYNKKVRKKKIGLGINSTAQAKYWNNPNGWQEVTDWLLGNGYEVIILSREEDNYMGNKYPEGAKKFPAGPIQDVINELAECEAFVGISSGLTWLAWVTDTPVIQISGFTEPFNEPNQGITKISAPEGSCSGCANKKRLDAGDWNLCPEHKGTSRQFECSKLISSYQVIKNLEKILNIQN